MHPPRNPSIRMQDTLADSRVDLRLAVSYVPACICFFKACVLLCVLSALHAAHFFNGCYVAVGLALVLDRPPTAAAAAHHRRPPSTRGF